MHTCRYKRNTALVLSEQHYAKLFTKLADLPAQSELSNMKPLCGTIPIQLVRQHGKIAQVS